MIVVLHSKYNVPTVRLLIAGEWSSGFLHTASTTSLSALDSFFALQQILLHTRTTRQSREGCSPYPFNHPTWLLLKKSLADSLLPLTCDRWQALVKTSYLRAPSTVGPFCLPVQHPPFPTGTIPVQSGNHASALSSSWSSFPVPPSSLPLVNYAHNPDPINCTWRSLTHLCAKMYVRDYKRRTQSNPIKYF